MRTRSSQKEARPNRQPPTESLTMCDLTSKKPIGYGGEHTHRVPQREFNEVGNLPPLLPTPLLTRTEAKAVSE